ncbi:hypothetical protein GW927_02535 [Candidatus Pacearchaeota archaeon]|nr:hypothetical protein [Candidatus Pacearchaeota archaeon]
MRNFALIKADANRRFGCGDTTFKHKGSMGINLPFFAKKKAAEPEKEALPNSFICIIFTDAGVRTAFWNIEAGEVVVQKTSSLIAFENDDDGVIATDKALELLGPDSEQTEDVVFGFDPHWVDDNGLIKEKKPFVKKVAESLHLEPVGFVIVTDALTQDLISRDKNISQILVYIQDKALSLILLKKGDITQQISVGRSEEVVGDIVEGLARFTLDKSDENKAYLPAKMVLASLVLGNQDLQDVRTKIIGYNWTEDHPFIQAPLVEQYTSNQVLKAVVEQGGAAIAEERGLLPEKNIGGESIKRELEKANPGDFGFESVETDLTGDNFSAVEKEEKPVVTSFGVPITNVNLPEEKSHKISLSKSAKEENELDERNSIVEAKKQTFMSRLFAKYQKSPHKNVIFGGIVGGVLASIGLLVGGLIFSYKVEVTVQLAEKVITKDVEITVDPYAATSNVEKLILRGELQTAEFSGTKVADVTGVKLVGEKAKGTITILNKTISPKTFFAGTSFTNGGQQFTLDEDATVASASVTESGTSEVKDYGQLDVKVTAAKIGAEGNLVEETNLSVENFDTGTYSATVKETFTGGSSREVKVVSAEDAAGLLKDLKTELFNKAKEDFGNKSGNGIYFVLTGKQVVVSTDYGGKIGEEADQLALELTMKFDAVKYLSEDMRPLIESLLKEEVPTGYSLVDDEPGIVSAPKEEATGSAKIVLAASVSTKALPDFDVNNVISTLQGLPLEAISGKLSDRTEIESASYQVKPSLARALVSKVPNDKQRIIIIVKERK